MEWLILSIAGLVLLSAWLVFNPKNVAKGWEDDNGFHYGEKPE